MDQILESRVLMELPSNYIPEHSRRCKVIIVGAKDVGKSTFIERVEFGRFNEEKSTEKLYRVVAKKVFDQTVTVEFVEKDLEEFADGESRQASLEFGVVDVKSIFLQQDMRDADAMVLFYAIDNADSFKVIKNDLLSLQRKVPPTASITIVGTKADVKDMKVSWQDVDSFAESQGFSCFETSSKSGVNVDVIVQDILEAVFEKKGATEDEDVHSHQPVYASTILRNINDEPEVVNGFCWLPAFPTFPLFHRGGGF